MRFLVDAHLPRALIEVLKAAGHDAIHTRDLPDGNRTTDSSIAAVADADGRVVISKDADFRLTHRVRGTPRRVLAVATGNTSNLRLVAIVEQHLGSIVRAFEHAGVVELHETHLVIHARSATD